MGKYLQIKEEFKEIVKELFAIRKIYPPFQLADFIEDEFETQEVSDTKNLLEALKTHRERIQLDDKPFPNDREIGEMMEDGFHIHGIIAQEQLYGED